MTRSNTRALRTPTSRVPSPLAVKRRPKTPGSARKCSILFPPRAQKKRTHRPTPLPLLPPWRSWRTWRPWRSPGPQKSPHVPARPRPSPAHTSILQNEPTAPPSSPSRPSRLRDLRGPTPPHTPVAQNEPTATNAILLLALLSLALPTPAADAPPFSATGRGGAVATVHPLATAAGIDALRKGGNAIDAAIAAGLTLGVVDTANSGIGGGCFILIRKSDGSLLAIDGRETAPAAATRDMFLKNGKADPTLSTTGPLASGVPGALAAYDLALREAGKLPLAGALLPAADLAEQGFPLTAAYASRLRSVAKDLARFDASKSTFLDGSGNPWPAGHMLKQPDLARTYRGIANHGADYFYRGPVAQSAEIWMKQNGGLLTAADFADYRPIRREPLVTTYRAYTIVGFPPPSSGGVHVAQILNILEHFDLADLNRRDPATRYHVIAEAMKLAFADRAFWLGDPDFAKVPRGLIDKTYAADLAKRIDLTKAIDVPTHGHPPAEDADFFSRQLEKHTTHVAAADAQGNWVAMTQTINTTFGSKVVIPGTGITLNDEMDDFSAQPGAPNAFGLVGAEANAVAPRKRPLSSMSPTIVLKDNRPILTAGAAGGPTIISQVVMTLTNDLDLGLPLPQSVAAPRIHHQWRPNELVVEPTLGDDTIQKLTALGHKVVRRDHLGVTQAIGETDGNFVAVHDPRTSGDARTWGE